ncbi:MAG: type II toxin-antitoxin system Phd/YefM family antitoxin [Thermoleophilia bacterium]
MVTVGAYEAKTHLSQLLDRVARGERVTITKHGRPVAILVPAGEPLTVDRGQAIAELNEFRRGRALGVGLTIRDMIEEGRRS